MPREERFNRTLCLPRRRTKVYAKGFKRQLGGTLRAISKSKAKEHRLYVKEVRKHLEESEECEIKSPVCTYCATCVHHTKGRLGPLLRDQRFWKRSCALCNGYCEDYKEWARENGFRLDRLGI